MSTPSDVERPQTVPRKHLWFGFAGASVAWILALALDVTWTGRGCPRSETVLLLPAETWLLVSLGLITFGMLAVAAGAGLTSYRNWRTIAGPAADLFSREPHSREEFMAIFGMIVSTSLAIGIFWFSLAVYLIGMCVRAH
ncbi:MAG TPA: hypothetical protein VIC33_07045 [Vicinamibacterales bacterium]|jgi:hypothetical protein